MSKVENAARLEDHDKAQCGKGIEKSERYTVYEKL